MDDDLHVALVVLDDKLIVLDGVARVRIAATAAEVEEVLVEAREHVLGEIGSLDGPVPRLRRASGHPTDYHRWLANAGRKSD